jgi:hypothetical protein
MKASIGQQRSKSTFTSDPSTPGGMAVTHRDLIASDERNQQVTADVLTTIHQNRNCTVLTPNVKTSAVELRGLEPPDPLLAKEI